MSDVMTFRPQSVTVEVGSKKTAIILEDIPFKKQKELLAKISTILLKREMIPASMKNIDQLINREIAVKGKSAEQAIKLFLDKLAELYQDINDEQVIDLLKIGSDDKITDEIMETMGATEMIELLAFIINRQSKALKNLSASLANIVSPAKNPDQK